MLIAQGWPRKRGKPKSPVTLEQNALFAASVKAIPYVDPDQIAAAYAISADTAYTWRDVLLMAMHGSWIELEGLAEMSISDQLDLITTQEGAMLYRGPTAWVGLLPPTDDAILAYHIDSRLPYWTTADNVALTRLSGDVTAEITPDSQVATIADTDVEPGSYSHASITVNSQGRIIDADVGAVATTAFPGTVMPDGTTIDVDGAGVISVIGGGGGGGNAPIAVATAANQATVAFTGLDSSTKLYRLIGRDVIPVTNGSTGRLQFGTGATPTWQTTGAYRYGGYLAGSGGFSTPQSHESDSSLLINSGASNTAASGGGAWFDFTLAKNRILGLAGWRGNDGHDYSMFIQGRWTGGNSFTAIRYLTSSGNVSVGDFFLYEIPLS